MARLEELDLEDLITVRYALSEAHMNLMLRSQHDGCARCKCKTALAMRRVEKTLYGLHWSTRRKYERRLFDGAVIVENDVKTN